MIQDLIATPWLMMILIALFSLCIGSLLNVVIYRLPLMLDAELRQQCSLLLGDNLEKNPSTINLCFPRSFCPNCNSKIAIWHNIPVFSYLWLKGRCYYCHHPIGIRYPFVELTTCFLSLLASWHFGFTHQLIFALLAIYLLIPLIVIDIEHQLLPDSLTLGLLWVGLIANTQVLFISLPNAVFSAAGAYLSLWLVAKVFYWLTGKIGMGHGDFKLFAALGAWFGWVYLPFIILLASISGLVMGLIYLGITKKSRDTPIPFGPFLASSGIIVLFLFK